MSNTLQLLNARVDMLRQQRDKWVPHWQDLRDYILPEYGYALEGVEGGKEHSGEKLHSLIIDGTASEAADVTAAGLQTGMTPPSRPWFRLGLPDKDLEAYGPVQEWLSKARDRLFALFAQCNLYGTLHHTYTELVGFGTGAMALLEGGNTVMWARPFTAGEFALGADHEGSVDSLYREIRMTARQMEQAFGREKLSYAVASKLEKEPDAEFTVCQMIEANDSRIKLSIAKNLAFRSVYWEQSAPATHDGFLKESGFESFPVMAPRWLVAGAQLYGRSPGMRVLGDVKMLKKLQEKSLIALDKQVDPPVQANGDLKPEAINSMPGGVTITQGGGDRPGVIPLYAVSANLRDIEFKIQQTQMRIKEGLYNDLFKMMSVLPDTQRTAREIAERNAEKLTLIGPVLNRLQAEMLDPLIDRGFEIALRANQLPPPPPELAGIDLKVEYIGMLAQAQRMAMGLAIEETASFAANLAAVKPDVLDVLDLDKAVQRMADLKGVDPELVRDGDDLKNIRKARADQEAQAQRLAAAEQMAKTAKTASEIPVGGDNVMTQMLGQPGVAEAAAAGFGAQQ